MLVGAAYATCAAFITFYIFSPGSINGHECYANYAVFYTNQNSSQYFTAYYYGWLLIGTYLAWHWGMKLPKYRKVLFYMSLGYLVFIIPTVAFNIIDPDTVRAIPSIMCGFAVLLAFVIVIKVLPSSCKIRNSTQKIHDKFNLLKNNN